jgi:NAD-dependent dihydropyrimidine dehydrogenase PreA subunit
MLGENVVSMLRSRRERFPWFPTIKCEECLLDLECLNFCPAGVFDWDPGTGKPVVARPFDCIPGCRSCAENCKGKNISLPGKREVAAALRRIRAEDGLPSSRVEGQGVGRGHTNLQLPSPRGEGQGWGGSMPRGPNKNRTKGNKGKPRNPGNRSVITLPVRGNKTAE